MSSSVTSSIELRLGEQEAFDITPFVKRFVWSESMLSGGFSWELVILTERWKDWESILFGRDQPRIQFRLISNEPEGPVSTEWRTAVVDKSRAVFGQNVAMLADIKGADARLDMAQKVRTRAWAERSVSSVLTQLASEHGLTPDIEKTAALDINIQAREDDWTFARRLAQEAATESGRGDAYLWVDEDALRFRAPQLTDQSERRYDMSVVENRVDGYVAAYNGREADREGAATLLGVGFNFLTKQATLFEMNPSTAATHPSMASRVPRRMEDGLRFVPVFSEAQKQVEENVRASWGKVASRYVTMRINTRPDLTLRPNTVISMEANLDERRQTPFMGRYALLEVQHVLEKSTIITTVVGYRREAQVGDAQPTGSNADTAGSRDAFRGAGNNPPKTISVARLLT